MAFRSQRPIGNSLFDEKRDSSIQWWKVILGIVFVGMVFFIIFSRNTVQTHLENEAKNNNNNNNVEEVKVKTASPTKAKNANSVTIVKCDTTKGPITIEVHPAWARRGAKRFLEMVEKNFFEKLLFYRVPDPNSNALMQIGYSFKPELRSWGTIPDDPHLPEHALMRRGEIAFAGYGKDSRTCHFFISVRNSTWLGKADWETPFAIITEGMDEVIDKITQVGDMKPWGPMEPGKFLEDPSFQSDFPGDYLKQNFPAIDWFNECHVQEE